MGHEGEEKEGPKKERIKKYLFKRPKPLNSWGHQEHRSESWMELFIDLFYVAFFIKLGDILHTCGAGMDIMVYVCSIFLGVCMAKFDFDQYMNKFATEDLLHKVFFTVYSMGLVVMILDVNESSEVLLYMAVLLCL
jgi:low temperature requirement protein LtrA